MGEACLTMQILQNCALFNRALSDLRVQGGKQWFILSSGQWFSYLLDNATFARVQF